MPDNNNNVSNENVSAYIWPTDNVITDLKFGTNEEYEIGIGNTTQEFLENVFGDIDENFGILNTTIEENEETISNALNDLNDRKADKADVPVVPTNVSAFTNDAGYLTQHQDISAYFNDVEYDSNSKRINFKNGTTVKKYIDATDFIKDGMVDGVTVGNATVEGVTKKCLIITFNEESGKETVNVPLEDIFDSDEYYTKDEIDDVEKVISSALNDLEERKLDASELDDYYTKAESDAKYLTSADASDNYYTKEEIDVMEEVASFALNDLEEKKLDASELDSYYTKTESDDKFLSKNQALEDYYTKDEIDNDSRVISSALNDLEERKLDATELDDYYTKSESDAKYLTSADASDDYYTKEEIDDSQKVVSSALNDLNTRLELKSDADDLADVATTGSYNDLTDRPTVTSEIVENSTDLVTSGGVYDVLYENEYIVSSALTDLDDRKADRSEIPNVPTNVSAFTNDAGYLDSSDISGKADKIPVVQHGTSDTTFTLTPNAYHIWGEVASLTLTLGNGTSGYLSEYMFEFTSGSTATTLSLPSSVKWPATPLVQANKKYQVSIINNIGLMVGVDNV